MTMTLYRANVVQTFKDNNNINLIELSAKSPDINIIEIIWLGLKIDIKAVSTKMHTLDQLVAVVCHAWEIFLWIIAKKIQEILNSLREVISMKGHLTKY